MLGLLLDARWGQCPRCAESHIWKKTRALGGPEVWRSVHITSEGRPCAYFSKDRPTAISELVEANPEAAS